MLTGKQRAFLRKLGNNMDAIVHIGKDGITDNLVKQADDAIAARELIKGSVQQNSELSAKQASQMLCEAIGAEGVSVKGRKFLLYRKKKEATESGAD